MTGTIKPSLVSTAMPRWMYSLMTISPAASSRLELKMECFFSVSATAFKTNGVSVSLTPFFSYLGANFFRSAAMRVKSISSNCVTRATALQLSAMRRAMTLRNGVINRHRRGFCRRSRCRRRRF